MQQVESHGGVIQRLGHMMTWHVDKELGSVLSNVQRHTEAFDGPLVAQNLASSTFDPRWLSHRPRNDLFMFASRQTRHVGSADAAVDWRHPADHHAGRSHPNATRSSFFLDEAAHLGKIRVLENAVTLMRGMGIRLWFFFQSVHQLQECYGEKAKIILDNIDTQQYFALNDVDNAEAVSKRIGEYHDLRGIAWRKLRRFAAIRQRGPAIKQHIERRNITYSDTARRLLKPEELMVLPEDVSLVFHRNLAVIPARLLKYDNHPAFRGGGTGNQPSLGPKAIEKRCGCCWQASCSRRLPYGCVLSICGRTDRPVFSLGRKVVGRIPRRDSSLLPSRTGTFPP